MRSIDRTNLIHYLVPDNLPFGTMAMATHHSHTATHSTGVKHAADPVEYEKSIYQKGLHFERPPFTFRSEEWERLAIARMSAESCGYVAGNAGTGETAKKNRAAFHSWSIVPKRLVKTEGLPDLSTKVLGQDLQFPLAIAPDRLGCNVSQSHITVTFK